MSSHLSEKNFIELPCFHDMKDKMRPRDPVQGRQLPSVVILRGRRGVGKSQAASQCIRHFTKEAKRENTLFLKHVFCCDSKQALLEDITKFSDKYNLRLDSLHNVQQRSDLGDIFENMFNAVNQRFPDHVKYLLFDDAELSTDVVKHIDNNICDQVTPQSYDKWKIIVTTTFDNAFNWLTRCDLINEEDNFIDVRGFRPEETKRFLKMVPIRGLDQVGIDKIQEKLGGLPLALNVAREYLTRNKLYDFSVYLGDFFEDMDASDPKNPDIACFHVIIEKVVRGLEQPEAARSLMKRISLLDEKGIPAEIFTALAEDVVACPIPNQRLGDNQQVKATTLSNNLVDGLTKRCLCDFEDSPTGHQIVSMPKLVRQSASKLRQDDTEDEERLSARMCIVAINRVIPRDDRMNHSLAYYGYIYRLSKSLDTSITNLKNRGIITRQNSPEIFVFHASLLSSMAYCHHVLCLPPEDVPEPDLSARALDVFSQAFTGTNYDDLREPDDVGKAQRLLSEGRGNASPLMHNPNYASIVENQAYYHRLTVKDLQNMFDKNITDEKVSSYLRDGHINLRYWRELTESGKIVVPATQEKIHYIEILIDIYHTRARIFSHSGRDLATALSCCQAALKLCEDIRSQDHRVSLMVEVIIKRLELDIELKKGDRNIDDIRHDYSNLANVGDDDNRKFGYEYGLRRTDFSNDECHKQLCEQGKAACYGKLCEQATQQNQPQDAERYFGQGDEIFRRLTQDHRQSEFKTLSKTYKQYASFLSQCGKYEEPVRALIDAMINLHKYLKLTPNCSPFPEQDSCGKFTDLYKDLDTYYGTWAGHNPNRTTMLIIGTDQERIEYLRSFLQYYTEHHPPVQADDPGRYPVIKDLIPVEEVIAVPPENGN